MDYLRGTTSSQQDEEHHNRNHYSINSTSLFGSSTLNSYFSNVTQVRERRESIESVDKLLHLGTSMIPLNLSSSTTTAVTSDGVCSDPSSSRNLNVSEDHLGLNSSNNVGSSTISKIGGQQPHF